MEIFPVHSRKKRQPSQKCRANERRDFHLCYKQILVVKIRLLICERFLCLNWILLRRLGCRSGCGGSRCTIGQRRFPANLCEFDKSSNRFFIAANWYAELRSTRSTFNLCASLFIRSFCRGSNENISAAVGRVQINAKTINTLAASALTPPMIYFWCFFRSKALIPRSALFCHSESANRKWNSQPHVFNLASDCFLLELSREGRQLFNLQKVATQSGETICTK